MSPHELTIAHWTEEATARIFLCNRAPRKAQTFCFVFVSSSAGSTGASLASKSSHLINDFSYLAESFFPFTRYLFFRRRAFFFPFCFCFCEPFFLHVHTSYCPASTASTAQRNQLCTKQHTTYVPIRVRQRKQTDRVGESQHVV